AAAAHGNGASAGQHPGIARDCHPAARRSDWAAVSRAVPEARRTVVGRSVARMTFRLMTYNIRHGGRGREAPIATVINACTPDLVLLQEDTHPSSVEPHGARHGQEEM